MLGVPGRLSRVRRSSEFSFPLTFPRSAWITESPLSTKCMVTITRPIDEAMNSVPGFETDRSITSRGIAEISCSSAGGVDMFQTLQYVNAAILGEFNPNSPYRDDHRQPDDIRGCPDSSDTV